MSNSVPNNYNGGGGKSSINSDSNSISIFYVGKVVSVNDEFDGGRIKVRIKGIDDALSDSKLPNCIPHLPKFFNITPKVGETAIVAMFKITEGNIANAYDDRLYFGPLISQPQNLNFDPFNYSSLSILERGITEPQQAPSTIPEANGVFPKKEWVSIQGRDNSDLIFKPSEVLLRAGKHEPSNPLSFNKKDMGYIQIKQGVQITQPTNEREKPEIGSVTNIVSSKINLLSYNGKPTFVLNDQENQITQEELNKILKEAHPLVFGDKLKEFLELVKGFVANHVHPYHGRSSDQTDEVKELLNFDFNSFISDNVKTN